MAPLVVSAVNRPRHRLWVGVACQRITCIRSETTSPSLSKSALGISPIVKPASPHWNKPALDEAPFNANPLKHVIWNRLALVSDDLGACLRSRSSTDTFNSTVRVAVTTGLAAFLVAAGLASHAAATSSSGETGAYVRPLDARHSPYVGGNRSPRLPTGSQGRIAVIARGGYLNGSVAVIVRNNTPRVARNIDVTGVATSASGRLLATGADQEMLPSTVRPGEIAIGYVFFDADLPPDARFKLRATDGPNWKRAAAGGDLVIQQSALAGDRVVGFARNGHNRRVEGPIPAYAACFTRASKLIDLRWEFTDQDSVPPRGQLPFDIELYNTPCSVFLVAVRGHLR